MWDIVQKCKCFITNFCKKFCEFPSCFLLLALGLNVTKQMPIIVCFGPKGLDLCINVHDCYDVMAKKYMVF